MLSVTLFLSFTLKLHSVRKTSNDTIPTYNDRSFFGLDVFLALLFLAHSESCTILILKCLVQVHVEITVGCVASKTHPSFSTSSCTIKSFPPNLTQVGKFMTVVVLALVRAVRRLDHPDRHVEYDALSCFLLFIFTPAPTSFRCLSCCGGVVGVRR